MDKIIELICEEARRRPGKRYVPKLNQVKVEVDKKLDELIEELMDAERQFRPGELLEREE